MSVERRRHLSTCGHVHVCCTDSDRVPNPDLVRMIILQQHRSDNRSALPHFGAVARPHRESKWGALPASARRGDDCTQLGRQRFARPRHAALGVWQGISGITASGRGAACAAGLGRPHRPGLPEECHVRHRGMFSHGGSGRVSFQLRRSLQPCSGIPSRFAPRSNELKSRAWSSKTEHMP
jgi:hypothetical protein